MSMSCSSCQSEKGNEESVVDNKDASGVLPEPAPIVVENCISADGNSNIYSTMRKLNKDDLLSVVADGSAFGAYIAGVLAYAEERGQTLLYFPESFEWIILKSGVISDAGIREKLEHPEAYADSCEDMSREQFFTDLLESSTKDDDIKHYQKRKLAPFYISDNVRSKILQILPDKLREALESEKGQ